MQVSIIINVVQSFRVVVWDISPEARPLLIGIWTLIYTQEEETIGQNRA